LEFIAGLHKINNVQQRIREMIDITGLEVEQHKRIGQLSKGYRQRVGLAQALIHDPQVLILDEPTTGLDPNQLADIRELIKQVGKEKTVMLSTHIMQEVEILCDRVIIINKGKIVTDKETEVLQQGDDNRIVIRVEFSAPADVNKLKRLKGVESVEQLSNNTYHIVTVTARDLRQDIFKFAVDHQLAVLEMNREERKLEDVFKELTGKK
jgi:ABC-2 type transport system ATP-binding protein